MRRYKDQILYSRGAIINKNLENIHYNKKKIFISFDIVRDCNHYIIDLTIIEKKTENYLNECIVSDMLSFNIIENISLDSFEAIEKIKLDTVIKNDLTLQDYLLNLYGKNSIIKQDQYQLTVEFPVNGHMVDR